MDAGLDTDAPLTGMRRLTRGQALDYTAARPIGQVAGLIHDAAVSMDIDPAFALAEAILEMGWGTSPFARDRHNWYAYQAYCRDPNHARHFASDADGIRIPLLDMVTNDFRRSGTYRAGGRGHGWRAGQSTGWMALPSIGETPAARFSNGCAQPGAPPKHEWPKPALRFSSWGCRQGGNRPGRREVAGREGSRCPLHQAPRRPRTRAPLIGAWGTCAPRPCPQPQSW